MLIGQQRLKEQIEHILNKFPRFSIIVGSSGKKSVAKYIADKLNAEYVECGISVDDVRDTLQLAYSVQIPTVYVFPDIDKMSLGAKNALLKATEEPPMKAYFIFTLFKKENLIDTLYSRGTVFTLDSYTQSDIHEYVIKKGYVVSSDISEEFYQLCDSPRDADCLVEVDLKSLIAFAYAVDETVVRVKDGTMFEFVQKLKLKEDGEGFNPLYVFKYLKDIYYKKSIETKDNRYVKAMFVTNKCMQDLEATFNKIATIDKWIFDIREALK